MALFGFWRTNSQDGVKSFFIAFCGSMIVACVFGAGNGYPSFTDSIRTDPSYVGDEPTQTQLALGSSLISGLASIFSIICGQLITYIGTRYTCVIAAIFMFLAYFVASFINHYSVVIIVLGLVMSVAYGFVLNSPAVAVSTWFDRKKPLGMGVVYSGAGLGMLTVPIMIGQLLHGHGWRATMRYVSFLAAIVLVASFFMVQREEEEEEEEEDEDEEEEVAEKAKDGADKDQGLGKSDVFRTRTPDSMSPDEEGIAPPSSTTGTTCLIPKEKEVSPKGAETEKRYGMIRVNSDPAHAPYEEKGQEEQNHHHNHNHHHLTHIIDGHRSMNHYKATPKEFLFEILLTKTFLSLYAAYLFFAFGFFGELYILVPYPAFWIGKSGTIYEGSEKIPLRYATFGSFCYGFGRLIGGPISGAVATKITDKYTFTGLTVIHAILMASLIAARAYWTFMIIWGLMGFCIGGFYATFFSIVTKRFNGPNLGLLMGVMVSATLPGGVCSPIITAKTLDAHNQFTYALVFFALCFLISATIVFFTIKDQLIKGKATETEHPAVTGGLNGKEDSKPLGERESDVGGQETSSAISDEESNEERKQIERRLKEKIIEIEKSRKSERKKSFSGGKRLSVSKHYSFNGTF